jgi:hypothetical protein
MSDYKRYDPSKVDVIFGVVPLSGWGDGAFVEITKNEEAFTTVVGADGITTRVRNLNNLHRVTITLSQQSGSNAALSALHLLDLSGNAGPLPIFIRDQLGTTVFASDKAWIVKFPDATFGKNAESRQWIIDVVDPKRFEGGA